MFLVCNVDEDWNYYVVDWFREKCTKRRGLEKSYDMYLKHGCIAAALQKYDRAQVEESIKQHGFNRGQSMNIQYVRYPPRTKENDRIEEMQSFFESGKVFLLPNMDWLRKELIEFPYGSSTDGLNALANIIKISNPTVARRKKEHKSALLRHIEALKKGIVRRLDGTVEDETDWRKI